MSGTNLLSQKYIGIDTKKEKNASTFPQWMLSFLLKKYSILNTLRKRHYARVGCLEC